ncbi:MAG: DUF3810 family protein, partial [Vulcanimicrobiaceae bacterium]
MLIAAGIFVSVWRPPPEWIEASYANGAYPIWQHLASSLTLRLPFALGDLFAVVGSIAIVAMIVRCWRSRAWLRMLVNLAMSAAIIILWFSASWGWNYDRAPLQTRVVYDANRVDAANMAALRKEAMARMNALA